MEAVVLYRMELELMNDCHVGLAVVKLDVDDVRCGSVGDALLCHHVIDGDMLSDVTDEIEE